MPARVAPSKSTGDLMANLDSQVKAMWPMFLGGAAINLFITYTKLLTGPLAVLWQIGGWISLAIGGYGAVSSGFQWNPDALSKGFHASRAYYAYPNFYPYPSPGYYRHYESDYVKQMNNYGYVEIPRISNALAAQEIINTSNYQQSSRNPMDDTNHAFSYIMDVY